MVCQYKVLIWARAMSRRIVTYVHGVSTGRDLAGVTLSQSPVDGVGKSVLAEVGDELLIDLKGGEVGFESNVSSIRPVSISFVSGQAYGTG